MFRRMALSDNTKVVLSVANFLALVVFVAGVVWAGSTFMNDIEKDIKVVENIAVTNKQDIQEIKPKVEENSDDIQDIKISDAENKIRIINIEARVLEIITILKDK